MIRNLLGAAALLAATTLGAGSALAAYNTASSPVASPAIIAAVSSSTASITAGGISSAIGGGFGGGFVSADGKTNYASNAKRRGGGFADSGAATGASAGSEQQRFGIWGNFGGSGFNEDQPAIATSGQVYTFMAGGDYRFNDWVLGGLSVGYERQDIDTNFNNGTWDANGAVVAPYVLVQLIPNQLYLDATAGYVGNSIDLTRNNGAITADTSGTRFFMASNLTATLNSGNFLFRPSIGANWTYQGIDGYTESGPGAQTADDVTVHFGQFLAGGQVGYQFGNVQPYLLAQYVYAYKYDLPTVGPGQIQPIAYKNSANVGGGLLFALSPRFSGGVQFQSQVGQTDYISYTGSGTIRYAF
ncbi:MAG: autotransporter outer membrane beta-barrel domain-containing protein [Alphaproteobacteria bacterium]